MALRDNAIVAYAETKVMKKSDRDVWVLMGEMLESLLDKTGFEKNEIDGLVMSGLTGTGGASMFWAQSIADMLGLEVGFCEQVHTGGCSAAGASRARPPRSTYRHVRGRVPACSPTPTCGSTMAATTATIAATGPTPTACLGPPGAFGLLQRAYDAKYGVDLQALGKLAVTQRNHAIMNENACEELRVPITIDDYINSRMIADPIRLLDCVMLADGAAGSDRDQQEAREGKRPHQVRHPDRLCRTHQFLGGDNLVDVTRSGHEIAGKKALASRRLEHQGRALIPSL